MQENVITVPVTKPDVFAEVVAGFQKNGLAFRAETTEKDFIITVTGC
jgi:hypothetical protein